MSRDQNQSRATGVLRHAAQSILWMVSSLQSGGKNKGLHDNQPLIVGHALLQVLERIADGIDRKAAAQERIAGALEEIAESVDFLAARPDENGEA